MAIIDPPYRPYEALGTEPQLPFDNMELPAPPIEPAQTVTPQQQTDRADLQRRAMSQARFGLGEVDPQKVTKAIAEAPTPFEQSFQASFMRNNEVAGFFKNIANAPADFLDPNYKVFDDVKGTKYENYWTSFVGVRNKPYADYLKTKIDQEENWKKLEDASGMGSFFGGLAAGFASPTILLPGAGWIRGANGVISMARSAAYSAGLGALGAVIQEGALQMQQETRTGTESWFNIGGAAALSGVLGGGLARHYSRQETDTAVKALGLLSDVLNTGDLSAANVRLFTREELSVDGSIAGWASGLLAPFIPNLRNQRAMNPQTRAVMQMLAESTLYNKINTEGGSAAPGGAAETLMKVLQHSTNKAGLGAIDEGFAAYSKAGGELNFDMFKREVSGALRRDDTHADPTIDKLAKRLRAEVFEPLRVRAVEEGLIPADLDIKGAESYLTRMYLRDMIIAKQGLPDGFEAAVLPWYRERAEQSYAAHMEKTNKQIGRLQKEIDLLSMDTQQRQQALFDIESGVARAEQENPVGFEVLNEIAGMRQEAARLRAKGDEAGAKRLLQDATNTLKGSKEAMALKQTTDAFQREKNMINKGFGGVEEKFNKLQEQLADLDDSIITSMKRLITRGRKMERELSKIGTEDELAEKVRGLMDDFAQAGEGFDNSLQRLGDMRSKMEAEVQALNEKRSTIDAGDKTNLEKIKQINDETMKAQAVLKKVRDQISRAEASNSRYKKKLDKIADRIELAETIDVQELKKAVQDAVDEVVESVADTVFKKNMRAQRLLERQADLDPALVKAEVDRRLEKKKLWEQKFYQRWGNGTTLDGKFKPDFESIAKDATDDVMRQITRTDFTNMGAASPSYMIAATRGPLKERVLPVPDSILEPFLENDITKIVPYYTRMMSAQIALSRMSKQLGGNGAPHLKDIIENLNTSYDNMIKGLAKAESVEEARAFVGRDASVWDAAKGLFGRGDDLSKVKEKLNTAINKERGQAIHDVESLRDIMLGRFAGEQHASGKGRLLRAGSQMSYVKDSGGFLVSSFADIYRPAMVFGIKPYMEAAGHLLSQSDGAIKAIKEIEKAGLISDRVTHGMVASFAEIGNPYADGTSAERLLNNLTKVATKWNGIALMQDFMESMTGFMAQERLIESMLKKNNTRLTSFLGIDEQSGMAGRVRAMLEKHMLDEDGVRIANTEAWTDKRAADAFRNALYKDTASTIIRPGNADVPLFFKTPVGQLLFQYRSFALAANQRILLRGLQEDGARFVSGLIGMTTIGMFVSQIKAARQGAEGYERWKKQAENPGFWIAEGLDNSGIFTAMFEVSNTVEKATKAGGFSFNPIKSPIVGAFGGKQEVDTQRTWGKGLGETMFGPGISIPFDTMRALNTGRKMLAGEELTTGDKRAPMRVVPFATMLGPKEAAQFLAGDSVWMR